VMAKLQDWAHELVEKHWGLKENAFEALMKSAMKNSGKKKDEAEGGKEAKQRTGFLKTTDIKVAHGFFSRMPRAPKNEEEQEMIVQKKHETNAEIFKELIDMATERSLTTAKAVETMWDNLRKGRFTLGHYIEMWLKRLGGLDDPVTKLIQERYETNKDMTTMDFGDSSEDDGDDEEDVVEYGQEYDDIVGKTVRTIEGRKLRVTREVWDSLNLVQSSWKKFWKRAKEKNTAKLSTEELRNLIAGMSNVIPHDKVPALDSFTERGEFGAEAMARRRSTVRQNNLAPTSGRRDSA